MSAAIKIKKTCLLSTVSHFERRFLKIDARRCELQISVADLCEAGGVRPRQWYRWSRQQAEPRPAKLRGLERGLAQIKRDRELTERVGPLFSALYRLFLAALAQRDGLDPAAVADADPTANAKGDPLWRAAAVCRHRAIYLTVTALNIPGTVAASIVGISKQAVSKALRAVEDSRDDPKVDRLLDEMATYAGAQGF